jgi:hypothetical protein
VIVRQMKSISKLAVRGLELEVDFDHGF